MSGPAQLFDAVGPRGRARQRIFGVVASVIALTLGGFALIRLGEKGNLAPEKWSPFATSVLWQEYLLPGLVGTIRAAIISVVLATTLGLLLGVGRLSTLPPLRWLSSVLVEFFRAVPVLMMMLFAFAVFSFNRVFPSEYLSLAAVVTGLTLYNGAVIAELLRAGVQNLPSGQREAGLSVGLTPAQALRHVQLPQALTAMLPALVSQLVVVLKDSALGYVITYEELLNKATQIGTAYANVVPALTVVALLFILLNAALTMLAGRVERRLLRRGHTSAILGDPTRVQPTMEPADP
ncbi:MAG TPA: amino acid ABC transporter permease [Dermatophilaceae bacterium]|nr:amino acid ABC transporter permease [Dermatophilaceae bacterium]